MAQTIEHVQERSGEYYVANVRVLINILLK